MSILHFLNLVDVVPPNIHTVEDRIIDWFNNSLGMFGNILYAFISIILACILSGIIGYERESHGHSAGFRTHILVSAGSALIMYLSTYAFSFDSFPNHDPARLAAQVVTGVGFLGAGAIMKNGVDIRGLTTATTLWICMAIGLACGSGRFIVSIFTTIVVIIVLKLLRKAERRAFERTPHLEMICDCDTFAVKSIKALADKYNIVIKNMVSAISQYNGKEVVNIHIIMVGTKKNIVDQFGEELRRELKPYEIKF